MPDKGQQVLVRLQHPEGISHAVCNYDKGKFINYVYMTCSSPEGITSEIKMTTDVTARVTHWSAIKEPADREPIEATVIEGDVKEYHKNSIKEALAAADGDKNKACEILGVSRRSLNKWIKEYGL